MRRRRSFGPPLPAPGQRRRMILQLTSLLDLLLIIVFVQYLEMQHVSALETQRRQDVEAQRDRLLARQHHLSEVWEIHLNGNHSVYPDGSILVASATQKKIIQPSGAEDFVRELLGVMKYSPKPISPCIFLVTWGNVRRDAQQAAEEQLRQAAGDERLRGAWGEPAVTFDVVEGGYLEEQ